MTPNKAYVDKVKAWLIAHWDEWYWVLPGNGVAMFELLKSMKTAGIIRSLEASHCLVNIALRQTRKEMNRAVARGARIETIETKNFPV